MTPDRPTDLPTDSAPLVYYSYRLTVPHSQWDLIRTHILHYAAGPWIVALHMSDEAEKCCDREHFHMAFFGFDAKKVDAMKKNFCKVFDGKGSDFHGGSFRDNHVSHAVGYMKHDEHVVFHTCGHHMWEPLIHNTPAFVKKQQIEKKERLGDPVLTLSNILKQALKYRNLHMVTTNSLQNVLSRMVNDGCWVPSRDLVQNGVPRVYHEMFIKRCGGRSPEYNWMKPHVDSDEKSRWLPVVDGHPISGLVEHSAAPPSTTI